MNIKTQIENSAYIKIHNFDCSISEISEQLGLQPDKAWLKGDLIQGRKIELRREASLWQLKSKLEPERPIEEHIESLELLR